ncbi:hypothetical protein Goari_011377 [Gossypium aridum]|uniref:DUF4283 domain-containing protein n=1 Tax=Gossypium aridum TaxID=34290 RepID=A0A7J8WX61_GOSAI|nr:hypothetical protein [Gossypium aridum]
MENKLAELSLEDGEEEILLLPNEFESQKAVYDFCFVGCFLIASVVHFPVMRSTIANLWHPWRVLNGAPWTFNNHLLVIHRLEDGKDPMKSRRVVLMSSVCLREEGEGELGEGNQGRSDLGRAF